MAVYFGQEQGLGELLGAGLGTGISGLLQQKMQQMQTRKGLESLLGPDKARQVSMLPPQLQQEIVKRQLQTQQQQERMNLFQQQYGGFQQGVQPGLETLLAGAQQGQPVGVPIEGAASLQGLQPAGTQPEGLQPQQPGPSEYVPGKAASLALSLGIDPGKAMEIEEKAKESSLRDVREQKREAAALKKETFGRKKYMTEQENKLWDKADPYINTIVENANSSLVNNQELDRFSELESGLDTPAYIEFLKGSGFNISALKSPDSVEFEKIRATFLRDMKKYFPGGKITNQEMTMFLKTLPDLSQTPEGRKRVLANLRRINNVSIQFGKSVRKVIKNNDGVPPRDLKFKVQKQMKARLDNVATQFKKDLAKPSPKFTAVDTATTALGRGLGGVIGAIPKLVGGVTSFLGRLGG